MEELILEQNIDTLTFLTEQELLTEILLRLENISSGIQIIIYVCVAFLLWKVIQILYKLLAHVFLGGL